MQVDPMASSFDSWSVYSYGMDNPVRYVDPTGMFSVGFNQDDFGGNDKKEDPPAVKYTDLPTVEVRDSYDRNKFTRIDGKLVKNTNLFATAQSLESVGHSSLSQRILGEDGFSGNLAKSYMAYRIQNNEASGTVLAGTLGLPLGLIGGIEALPILTSGYVGASALYFEGSLLATEVAGLASTKALGYMGVASAYLYRNTGGSKQWVRLGGSYSHNLGQKISLSIRWGASPANKGKYLKKIGSPLLRGLNQWFRQQRAFPGGWSWRSADSGHFHLKK
jgi:hypothetical protein